VTKIRRRPSRSPSLPASRSRPPKAIMYAFTTHARLASEKPRSSRIAGSATFTMVMSRTIISIPVQRTMRAANRRRSGGIARSRGCMWAAFTDASKLDAGFRRPPERNSGGEEGREVGQEDLGALAALLVGVQAVQEGALLGHHELRPARRTGELDG